MERPLGLCSNFLAGGLLALLLKLFLFWFKEKNAAEVIGFLYGAPFVLPYISFTVYSTTGADSLKGFVYHTILGIVVTLPLLGLLLCMRTSHMRRFSYFASFYLAVVIVLYVYSRLR